ncbi:BOP1NT-domain-containing protein [Piedraia hortae CBS 480.64]|uniref:Ribosome biogenesis protein ERB1 n=1 Tax=Piedraia hortae CBS 480.64 TaxID=1314780 RepID=A0A6A7C5J2_9PEZI|nr:BOP1NT-domain-containing protein [Piedraia hortae CBS 480.64]
MAGLKRKATTAKSEAIDNEYEIASDLQLDLSSDGESHGESQADSWDGIESDSDEYTITEDANGNVRYIYPEIDPVYDSDDTDAAEGENTVGNIPLSYYDAYPHIGYDINGKRIARPAKGEALDSLLDSIDLPEGWTGLTDPATGKPLRLSNQELDMLKQLTKNEIVNGEGFDPYPDYVDWFTHKEEIMPLSAAPEPKRRFVPSMHEHKRVMKMVKAIKEGRIKPWREITDEEREKAEEEEDIKRYDVWADEKPVPDHVMNIPAPKLPPPGFAESYRPPREYLPDENEKKAWQTADPEERERDFLPQEFSSVRLVPGYEKFVEERLNRCLDLYLAPRVRRSKLNIDPEDLLPQLPDPESLKPFPSTCTTTCRGHKGRVRSVSFDPSGTYMASGGDDGTVRIWEPLTGRQLWHTEFSEAVNCVAWRPGEACLILAACSGDEVHFIIPTALCTPAMEAAGKEILSTGFNSEKSTNEKAKWILSKQKDRISLSLGRTVKVLNFHRKGDYFTTVSPSSSAPTSSVAIHILSQHTTSWPFKKVKGLPQTATFHPTKPHFVLVTQRIVKIYDLARQELVTTLHPGARWVSSVSMHPAGTNLVLATYDRKLLWHDLQLGNKPYKTLRFHESAIRVARFHDKLPLFADASDDGTCQVFHGGVVRDGLENATIVPLKVLRGHRVMGQLGVLDLNWHPREAWLVSAGSDGTVRVWT